MKTIGLIGGTGWISTVEYYRMINEAVNKKSGGPNYARCIIYSFNYGDIDKLNKLNDLEGVCRLVIDAAERIQKAGADCIVLCANTLHQFADEVKHNIPLPLIHIAEGTAGVIMKDNFRKVGLLGTLQTMEMDFYKATLKDKGIETIVPDKEDRNFIEYTIKNELFNSIFSPKAKERFLYITEKLKNNGAEAIILGCTEIPLLINQNDTDIKLYHTTSIHAEAAVKFALSD
jgi:aspartate racemase